MELGARAHPHHEAVEREFGDLHPGQRFVAIGAQTRIHLAEMRIALGKIRIDLVGGTVAGFQHLLRERTQLRAGHEQAFQRRRVHRVIFSGHPGEGVFGLRRAFQIAGVETLIMSLWSVDDEATREWMKALYEARLVKGMSSVASVHEASLSILEKRRERKESTHPFYWGAFVAAGDWR